MIVYGIEVKQTALEVLDCGDSFHLIRLFLNAFLKFSGGFNKNVYCVIY